HAPRDAAPRRGGGGGAGTGGGRSPRRQARSLAADGVELRLDGVLDFLKGVRGRLGVELDRALGTGQRVPVGSACSEWRPALGRRKQVEELLVLGVIQAGVSEQGV